MVEEFVPMIAGLVPPVNSTEEVIASPRPMFRDRLTVIDKVYHQPKTGEAFCCESTFERWLDHEESVYSRKMKAGEAWQLLKLGWFTDEEKTVGMLLIRNDEGSHRQTLPTDEEKAETAKKVLEVGVQGISLFVIPPGESFRGVPSGQDVYVRCLGGDCSYTVFAFPK